MSNEPVHRPGVSKLINLIYPNTTPQSPGLMLTTDSESTVSSDGTKPGTEDPSPLCRECMPHHIAGMAG